MPRYVARWSSDLDEDVHSPETMTIFEDEPDVIDTGLLDEHGRPLYRVTEKRPIGFKV